MKPRNAFILAFVIAVLVVSSALAQSSGLTIAQWSIGSSVGYSSISNNTLTLQGMADQMPVGVAASSDGRFQLSRGFWSENTTVINVPHGIYLPVLAYQPVTPTPQTPTWQRLGGNGLEVAALAVTENQLFIGVRGDKKGLYKKNFTTCDATNDFAQVNEISSTAILDVAFQNEKGIVASFDSQTLFYSTDSGSSWAKATTAVIGPSSVAIAGNGVFYAGTDNAGVYRSDTAGVTWQNRSGNPKEINTLRIDQDPKILWIGTQNGVQQMNTESDVLRSKNTGLASSSTLQIYDFEPDNSDKIYLATYGGVFWSKVDISSAWEPFGLQNGSQVSSLTIDSAKNLLYAGLRSGGVFARSLDSSQDWTPVTSTGWKTTYTVRDLLLDTTICHGLLAATDDGVWVYK